MKSKDLINWTHTVVNINEISPELADIGCAWAPETIYDEKAGRLMIYFTMRHKNGPNKLYYVYANNQQSGPFDVAQLKQQVAAGTLNKQTYVWKDGMAGWAAAGTVPELACIFMTGTPPPPPPPMMM